MGTALAADLEGISFRNGRRICTGLRLDVGAGELVVLRAPNGWGKSVLLRFLGGWGEDIHGAEVEGCVVLGGKQFKLPVESRAYAEYARRTVGALFHRLSDESFGVSLGEESEQVRLRYVRECGELPQPCRRLLERLQRLDWDTPMEGLAKGLRQALALLDVLADVGRRTAVLLDEPTSYLAADLVEEVHDLLAWARGASPSCAIVVASHDNRLAFDSTRRVALAAQGENDHQRRNVDLGVLETALQDATPADPVGFLVQGSPVAGGRQLPMRFEVRLAPGHSALVTGPNGSGKSTLLHTMAGVQRLRGRYRVETAAGLAVPRRRVLRTHVGMVYQEPHEYEFRSTVGEVLHAGPWLGGAGLSAWERFVEDLLRAYGIPGTQPPRTLSSGQLRVVWLASQLGWTSTWLLDEATAALDGGSMSLVEGLIAVHVDRGGSVVTADSHMRLEEIERIRLGLGGPDRCDIIEVGRD